MLTPNIILSEQYLKTKNLNNINISFMDLDMEEAIILLAIYNMLKWN